MKLQQKYHDDKLFYLVLFTRSVQCCVKVFSHFILLSNKLSRFYEKYKHWIAFESCSWEKLLKIKDSVNFCNLKAIFVNKKEFLLTVSIDKISRKLEIIKI